MKKDIIKVIVMGVILVAIVLCALFLLHVAGYAEPITEQVWVLCDPESYVTLRTGPGKNKPEFGGGLCGAEYWTDGKTQNGFLHILEVPAEESEGWVSARYIVYDRPVEVNERRVITGDGRVACRKWVNGKIKSWVMPGDEITVYWMSASWAVTSRGYIKSDFISGGGAR